MSRHERDAVSLMGGLLLVLVAVGVLVDDLTSVDVDVAWVLPGLLVAIGLVGLLATTRRRDGDRDPAVAPDGTPSDT